ncbi:MAG TPA: M56 family metallopeptidase [Longimicrobiales bacterium]|nr:M56 family metallopeptidase [Longimicrobiales bacterium]
MITQAFLRGAVVFVLAGLLTVVLSKRSAAVRHNIWASAIIIQLALLAFIPTLPQITLPVLPTLSVTVDEPVVARRGEGAEGRRGATTNGIAVAAPGTNAPTPLRPYAPTREGSAPSPQRSLDGRTMLFYAWLAGALLVFARYALGTLLMMRLAQKGTRVDEGEWLTLSQRIAKEMGITRPITLLWGDKLAVPITWGILYPMILLPESASEWTLERRRFVLVHEMAHVRRFDALTQFVAQITLAVFWFSPFVWLAEWRLRVEREHACDDVVLHHGTEATLYADELLQMVRSLMSRRAARPAFAALAMARRSEFEGRMLAILDPERKRSVSGLGSGIIFLLISLLIAAPVAALNPVAFNVETKNEITKPLDNEITKSRNHEITKQATSPSPSPSPSAAACDINVTTTHSSINVTISEGQVWHLSVRLEQPGRCIVGKADGQFVLNDDETDVREMGRDAAIALREVTASSDIAVAMQPKEDGGIHTTIENTGSGPMNTAIMHRWIASVLPQVMAEAAYHTDERVARLLSAHGLIGTLETIARIHSSSSLAYHYLSLIEARKWNGEEMMRIRRAATRMLQGYPSDLARVLRAFPTEETLLKQTGSKTAPDWLAKTLESIESDGELHAILKTRVSTADKTELIVLARAAEHMQSGFEQSGYLIEASSFMLTKRDKDLENAWFKLADKLESSYERKNALIAAISFAYGNPRVQNMIAESASHMSSDQDKSAVLVALSAVR